MTDDMIKFVREELGTGSTVNNSVSAAVKVEKWLYGSNRPTTGLNFRVMWNALGAARGPFDIGNPRHVT